MFKKSAFLSATLMGLIALMAQPAQASDLRAAEGSVTGAPAVIIIIVVLALIVIGIVAVVRFVGRKAKGK